MPDETPEDNVHVVPVDPSMWDEQVAVTGRPNDIGPDGPPANSTFADRARSKNKQVSSVRAKAEADEDTRKPRKGAARRSG